MQGKLIFETDWDFSIEYKGKIYTSYDFEIYIESAQDFDKINFLGPYGSGPTSGKFSEVEEMLQEIRANLEDPKCFLGGNRGVKWIPYTTEAEDIEEAEIPKIRTKTVTTYEIFGREFETRQEAEDFREYIVRLSEAKNIQEIADIVSMG